MALEFTEFYAQKGGETYHLRIKTKNFRMEENLPVAPEPVGITARLIVDFDMWVTPMNGDPYWRELIAEKPKAETIFTPQQVAAAMQVIGQQTQSTAQDILDNLDAIAIQCFLTANGATIYNP